MTLASVFLVVLASFIHATWNLLSRRAASVGPIFVSACNVVACVAYAPRVFSLLARGDIGWSWLGAILFLPVVVVKPASGIEL